MVQLRKDAKYATRWDARELKGMDDAVWARHNRLNHDIHQRMQPLEADFLQRWMAEEEEEELAARAGELIDLGTFKFKERQLVPLILTLIREREMHGFQISQAISEQTKGQYELRPEVLHLLLHVLEEAGVIEGVERTTPDGSSDTYFRLTLWGEKHLGRVDELRL